MGAGPMAPSQTQLAVEGASDQAAAASCSGTGGTDVKHSVM